MTPEERLLHAIFGDGKCDEFHPIEQVRCDLEAEHDETAHTGHLDDGVTYHWSSE